ncbi:MAG: stage 0 sporulation protein [Clostridia bacterium]|nr:stage 0 sporulation protein [Clostridia bacterium]
MQKIIGAKKIGSRELEFFGTSLELNVGDKVVVEVEEFQTIVEVVETESKISKPAEEFGKVLRIATDADLSKYESLEKKAKKEVPIFKKKSLELGLMMKFVKAEYSLDSSKILIVFSSEERVDFRQFLKELASMLKTRIELKQIGQRDEVKMLGGVGPCGQPCCCARFLKDFEHVTVKMAKVQSLSLSPTKINGVCGRLMCCLGYESKMYEEQLAKMPKVNSEVETPNGIGNVVYNDILRERVSVKRKAEGDTIVVEEFELNQIKGYGEPKKEETQSKTNEHKKPEKQENKKFDKKEKQQKPQEIILGGETKAPNKPEKESKSEEGKNKKFNNNKKKFFKKNDKK